MAHEVHTHSRISGGSCRCSLKYEPLQLRLLVYGDEVDVVAASRTEGVTKCGVRQASA
jgi:hypothetical protein